MSLHFTYTKILSGVDFFIQNDWNWKKVGEWNLKRAKDKELEIHHCLYFRLLWTRPECGSLWD